MSDDVFRIVVTVAVVLACLAFVVQACVAIGLYSIARKLQERISPLAARGVAVADSMGPVIDKVGPIIDQVGPVIQKTTAGLDRATTVLTAMEKILEDARPRVTEVTQNIAAITKTGRQQVERIGSLVEDASGRARERLEQIDHSVSQTVEQVEHAGDSVKRVVMRPVREVNGFAAGISAAVSTLVHGSGRSSVDHATQDEEMFI
jgi:methyl-accepting chemotaxis protein